MYIHCKCYRTHTVTEVALVHTEQKALLHTQKWLSHTPMGSPGPQANLWSDHTLRAGLTAASAQDLCYCAHSWQVSEAVIDVVWGEAAYSRQVRCLLDAAWALRRACAMLLVVVLLALLVWRWSCFVAAVAVRPDSGLSWVLRVQAAIMHVCMCVCYVLWWLESNYEDIYVCMLYLHTYMHTYLMEWLEQFRQPCFSVCIMHVYICIYIHACIPSTHTWWNGWSNFASRAFL